MRLFVALELPETVRRGAAAWRDELRLDGLRPVADPDLHVTLCFLGEVEETAGASIGEAVAAAAAGLGPLPLVVGVPVWLPSRRPRVLAIGVDDPGGRLHALQAAVGAVLSAGGWYGPERRPYLGHVTVARVRGSVARPARPPAPPALAFRAHEVAVIRSRLGAGPARYERLRTIALAG